MWVEIIIISCVSGDRELSSSSWGCELKYSLPGTTATVPCHPLREDVSWNILSRSSVLWRIVILFVRMWVEMPWLSVILYLPRVILFVRMWVEMRMQSFKCSGTWCHPLREDVSWNIFFSPFLLILRLSSSSWGCELKCTCCYFFLLSNQSSSSWGCELKCSCRVIYCKLAMSSSSWGCELKLSLRAFWRLYHRHPLREDVSWNNSLGR